MIKTNRSFKTTVPLLLLLGIFLALGLPDLLGSPSPWALKMNPSLQAVYSPGNNGGGVDLSWDPYNGAAAYKVLRAPLSSGPFSFKLLALLPASQTFFSDFPDSPTSFVYLVVAVSSPEFAYPLAGRLVINRFGGLVPVSLDFHPNSLSSALASLDWFDAVKDANSGEYLSASSPLSPGMVLQVENYEAASLSLVGTMPSAVSYRFKANSFKMFAVPLGYEKPRLKDFMVSGLKGAESHSIVFSDGNNQQIPDDVPYLPGQVYGVRFDRATDIDFTGKYFHQDAAPSLADVEEEELLGGSPDDGTRVVVLYDNSYETKLYKCWSSGKSGAWDGVTDNASGADNVKNAAVVRRGRTMFVKDEAGMTSSTPVTVLGPSELGNPRQTLSWTVSWNSSLGAAAVQIPSNAPVGDYQVRVGTNTENYVTVYIIFDPDYALSYLDANEYRSWAYSDDDWQTLADKKNYLNYVYEGPGYPLGSYPYVYGYRGDHSSESGVDGGVFGQRWVEMACSIHGSGAASTLDAALHCYEVVGQRVNWVSGNGWYGEDGGVVNTFDNTWKGTIKAPSGIQTITELDVVTAERAALGLGWTNRFPSGYQFSAGACFNYGTCLTAMIRALGIPARCQHAIGGDGWTSSFHVWAEAFLYQPGIHPLDSNWWDSFWYEFDANRPYTSHTTSHSEGSICPIVISGYGDYLINEYQQCEGIGYDGSFFDNSFKCTPPGANTGTHTAPPLKNGTTNDAEDTDSYPLICTYANSSAAWQLMNLFVPWNGPARPSGDANVYDSHHGYALNDSQTGRYGGTSYTANSTNEDDLPVLPYGVEQQGLVSGWGFMMYRVPVDGRASITVSLVQGSDKVEILGTLDRNIYSTDKRWDLNYDFRSDASGVMTANTSGGSQLYLWVQLKNFSVTNPGLGQEVARYTIRAGDNAPYVSAQFNYSRVSDYQVQFTDQSIVYNDTITGWSWNFGDGTASTQQNPTHTFTSSGYFNVTLAVTGQSGANDAETQSLYVGPNQAPTADFTYTTLGGNAVSFSDHSTDPDGTIAAWAWNFGDGATSTIQNPSHTYASPGTYNVTLTVTDDDGATDPVTIAVSVILQYCASSSSSSSYYITQVNIGSFSNSSGASTYTDFSSQVVNMNPGQGYSTSIKVNDNFWTGYTRIWIDYNRDGDFTDTNEKVFEKAQSGGTISGTITVPSSGVVTGLTLGMRVRTDSSNYRGPCDTAAGWGEVEDYTVILAGSGGNVAPDANFTYSATLLVVNFTDTSTDSDGTVVSWSWNFGDSGTSTQRNPSHTYASAGTYTVTLTVTDNGGLTDSTSQPVTVTAGGGNTPPTSNFTFSVDDLTAMFSQQSSDSDGTVVGWSWDFGDGFTSDAKNVAHTFTAAGTYSVTLTVTDDDGATGYVAKNVTVTSPSTAPEADFTSSANGGTVSFTDTSRDPDADAMFLSWSWNFGDGATSSQQNPSHTYAASGTYTVTLTVTDNHSLTDPVSKSVSVTTSNNPPTANFTFTTTNLTATFTDTSTDSDGTIQSWAWNFGDSGTSTQRNPNHTYAAAGTYNVTLTVTDDDGATDSETKSVTVTAPNNPPTANFTFTTNALTATFTDTSTDSDGTIQSWSWNFGDSGTSTQRNPSHTYAATGTYNVTLTVTDDDGATDPETKSVTVSSGGGMPTYCASSSSSANPMAITKFQVGTFSNSSGKSTYSNFTNQTINLTKGQGYTVKITLDSTFYTSYSRVWIDYNGDGDFTDAGEKVFEKSSKTPNQGTFTVPGSGVVTGQKLGLRVHSDTMSYKNPCDVNLGWGEVEDYAVIIQ